MLFGGANETYRSVTDSEPISSFARELILEMKIVVMLQRAGLIAGLRRCVV
jgi:hypothetical protein